jgi:hypothetical protein
MLGLIQFDPENQCLPWPISHRSDGAVEAYLRDRGVKPGMGMLDVYSTINVEQDGRLVMAEILDEELAVGPLEKSYLLLEDAWCAEFTAGEIEVDGAPCRRWKLLDLGKQLW